MATTTKGTAPLLSAIITSTQFVVDGSTVRARDTTEYSAFKDEKSEDDTWAFVNPGMEYSFTATIKAAQALVAVGDQDTLTFTPGAGGSGTDVKAVCTAAEEFQDAGVTRQNLTYITKGSVTLS
jgi:hypothetical protein